MAALTLKACLEQTSILVIKVGSSLLIDEKGNFCEEWLGAIAEDIRTLHPKKKSKIGQCETNENLINVYIHATCTPFKNGQSIPWCLWPCLSGSK